LDWGYFFNLGGLDSSNPVKGDSTSHLCIGELVPRAEQAIAARRLAT